MHPVVYDVAVSLDGFISGPSGDISRFAEDGPVVADYQTRLAGYATAIMGRKTYEFGYRFGLEPGQNPYPWMRTIVFSRSLNLPGDGSVEVHRGSLRDTVSHLKSGATGPIYLCGGGSFAGAMLERALIDRIVLKRAPCALGGGVPLFGLRGIAASFERLSSRPYENGYMLEELKPV
jgi:dihydrofolate reductase